MFAANVAIPFILKNSLRVLAPLRRHARKIKRPPTKAGGRRQKHRMGKSLPLLLIRQSENQGTIQLRSIGIGIGDFRKQFRDRLLLLW